MRRVAPAAAGAVQFFGPRPILALARAAWAVLSRAVWKVPVVGVLEGGAFVAWEEAAGPLHEHGRTLSDRGVGEHRERESQKSAPDVHEVSFRDTGATRAYFTSSRTRRGY